MNFQVNPSNVDHGTSACYVMFDPDQLQTGEQQGKHKQDLRPHLDFHHATSKLLHIYCDNLPVTDHLPAQHTPS